MQHCALRSVLSAAIVSDMVQQQLRMQLCAECHLMLCSCMHVQISWWRAHEGRIASVQTMPQQGLVLLASHDRALSLWTLAGGLVGRFGMHTWRISDTSSFQDLQVSCCHLALQCWQLRAASSDAASMCTSRCI